MKNIFLILSIVSLTITSLASQVTLAWCPNTETNVSYVVYYGTGPIVPGWVPDIYVTNDCPAILISSGTNYYRNYTSSFVVTNATATVSNLQSGQIYYFAVSSKLPTGEISAYSSEVRLIVPPKAPTGLRIINP